MIVIKRGSKFKSQIILNQTKHLFKKCSYEVEMGRSVNKRNTRPFPQSPLPLNLSVSPSFIKLDFDINLNINANDLL